MTNFHNIKIAQITVERLRLRAYIGFQEWETKKLQDVVISYAFKYNMAAAAEKDDVQFAVNYKKINKGIINLVSEQKFNLIENLAEQINDFIQKSAPEIISNKVTVEKPNALRFTDNVKVTIDSADRYHEVIIALGSNINPEENCEKAISHLQNIGQVIGRTKMIWTKPLKFDDQPDFLNGAVLLYTKKNKQELALCLREIETSLGRIRTENKNAPRTIDLDITTFNNKIIDTEFSDFPFLADFVRQLAPHILPTSFGVGK